VILKEAVGSIPLADKGVPCKMPMNLDDVKTLVDWLGLDGARAGLETSNLSVAELRTMAEGRGLRVSAKARRTMIVDQILMFVDQKINKSLDEMLAMSLEELLAYFERVRPSRTELLELLERLDFHPGSEAQRGLYKYAARQISEVGLFQRVARSDVR
jgi:hypothetical protein